ncbi:putative phosphoribosyl-ATP pyrophosphohydrolase [[Clostridium] bifermentans ATCC 19299]|uniref:nucleoside triphosphate pyrophosphohydrolase n=1 Tax=Paraclostridium bifermentans TaxID=1490 RepID=UPI00038DB2CC|nr:nucleoside triphosphate pyrophosphohydrolase [Paraclostridium bifermentans]EQK46726.1 putative phosphoribosyl-ATP pyrophosphohydrolase [[Clostridium] bifermentans ATCC 19299] [Paraclostridium bifermentans ATCC 19299]
MKVYDKLVRDRIPEIIESSGNKCEVEVVSNEIALEYLYKKLNEEVSELLEDKNLDEIADVIEVLFAIGSKYGYSEEDVLNRRNEKKYARGGFEDNLIWVCKIKCVFS